MLLLACGELLIGPLHAQRKPTLQDRAMKQYGEFNERVNQQYDDFRTRANRRYAAFLREKWVPLNMLPAFDMPEVPPLPILDESDFTEPDVEPVEIPYRKVVTLPPPKPQPTPVEPVPEVADVDEDYLNFRFYGTACKVRVPAMPKASLGGIDEDHVANLWEGFSTLAYNNLLVDCIRLREELSLSDWAYFKMLGEVSKQYLGDGNDALVLWAFLFTQTGYSLRIGRFGEHLYLLLASNDNLALPYYEIKGEKFYVLNVPRDKIPSQMNTSVYSYDGERKMDFLLRFQPQFAWSPSSPRRMASKTDPEVTVDVSVNKNLIDFYNTYPCAFSKDDPDGELRWAYYANASFSKEVKDVLYPVLRKAIAGKGQIEAANIIIHFMQTTLVYRYDNEIWGYDRAFFAEETLYYPYSDCEDRAILFSRLIRDLLHLDVVLLNLPGHLATAVAFDEPLRGGYYLIDGKRYYYCEPTCSSAVDVGWIPDQYINAKPIFIRLD